MSKRGIGIVGTGSIVHTYQRCIDEIEGTDLIALYSKSQDRSKTARSEFGVPVYHDSVLVGCS